MTNERRECRERETDKISYKITQIAGIITAIGIIGSVILYIGSMFFQTIKNAEATENKFNQKILAIETQQTETDKNIVELKTDVKYIREGITEIKQSMKK